MSLGKRLLLLIFLTCSLTSFAMGCAPVTTTVTSSVSTSTIPFFPINVASKPGIGNYLVDRNGMTLYYNKQDTAFQSNVTRGVLDTWPVFWISNIIVPISLDIKDFVTIKRVDNSYQTTFKGWPLYYFVNDKVPGDTLGHASGGLWFVVNVDTLGKAPEVP